MRRIKQQENTSRVSVVGVHGEYRVIAIVDIAAGEVILDIEGREVDAPSRYSVQVGKERHIEPPKVVSADEKPVGCSWMYLNHGCEPTAYVQGRQVIALRDICAGKEVTFDYCTTEYDMAEPFHCRCGAKSCRGWVQGFRYLPRAEQLQLRPRISDYLLEAWEKLPVSVGIAIHEDSER